MRWIVEPGTLAGEVRVPGDKSIAHRALLLGALAHGESVIEGLPDGEDVRSTARCLRALGVQIEVAGTRAVVAGGTLGAPATVLDAGNSGTTMRLLAGILAAQPFDAVLDGDNSLRRRPMERVLRPLWEMGAVVQAEDGHAPLRVHGSRLHGIHYQLPVASAQVKSAILLAGLFAEGRTSVEEPTPARDHTERMLRAQGVPVERADTRVSVTGGCALKPLALEVPGDISSAAFFLVAAALGGNKVTVHGVGVNPTRTGIIGELDSMGALVTSENQGESGGEPVASVTAQGGNLQPLRVEGDMVPVLVDELPLLALAATQASGTSRIAGAAELRVKETDRISGTGDILRAMGANVEDRGDGWLIHGPTRLHGARVEARGDHRLAMTAAIAGGIAVGRTTIDGAEAAAVSYPNFAADFVSLGGRLRRA